MCDLAFSLWLLRQMRGWSQEQMARKLSTTRQTVSNWEIGVKTPTLASLRHLCRGLNVPVWLCLRLAEARNARA